MGIFYGKHSKGHTWDGKTTLDWLREQTKEYPPMPTKPIKQAQARPDYAIEDIIAEVKSWDD